MGGGTRWSIRRREMLDDDGESHFLLFVSCYLERMTVTVEMWLEWNIYYVECGMWNVIVFIDIVGNTL